MEYSFNKIIIIIKDYNKKTKFKYPDIEFSLLNKKYIIIFIYIGGN